MNLGSYQIQGGRPIEGEYTVKGAKNAVLPILAASIVTGEENLFSRCPDISDVQIMQEILESLGCKAVRSDDRVWIDTSGVNCCEVPRVLMEKMRSSIFLIGPLLTRCGRAVISQPGGCAIGRRPIDLHMKALSQMGADIEEKDQQLIVTGNRLYGTNLILDFPRTFATTETWQF